MLGFVAAYLAAVAFALPARVRAAEAPTLLVDPFVGTSFTRVGGPIDTFPGADVPFGMVQWSPDTPTQNAGGGYEYTDTTIDGFSLTHLSGPGCNVFGDFAMLPTLGPVVDPRHASQPFSHAGEIAAPGWYQVTLGKPAIGVALTVTQRTGLGLIAFPASSQANILFNVSSNQAGVDAASVRVVGANEVEGSASSGHFCGMPDRYTVYFVAQFDRPFVAHGTWLGSRVTPGSAQQSGAGSGGWVTFDTTAASRVKVKVGLSFVSLAGARANLAAENRGWDLTAVRDRATAAWSRVLGRVAIQGGTNAEERTFYTALYHAFLHPNLISDVDGRYMGFDDKVHSVARGHAEYANFSDWDIYRSEIPLIALLAPHHVADMMQSLVDAARQEHGWLPRWPLVNGPTSVMGGDSVDAVIAGAYAYGARAFDARGALAAMVQGASTTAGTPGQGWYVPRWELNDRYLQSGYVVNTHTTSVAPVPNGASETLEYAFDDFSIARLARSLGDDATVRRFSARSANWAQLFDTATGWIAPRDALGAFMAAPIGDMGQSGFQEGNAAQYSWMVPQDLHDLIAGMGGRAAVNAKLDRFFSQLNAGQDKPYAWLGNEPSLGSPWVYLSSGEPWRTQAIVRQALTTLYADTPEGIPGNDDLGEMSSWYVWSALGLYPGDPATRLLDIGSPLFTHVVIRAPHGPTIEIDAPKASDATPYVNALRIDGRLSQASFVALPERGTLRLDFDLAATPNVQRGTATNDAPPSYPPFTIAFPPATSAAFVALAPSANVIPGGSTAVALGLTVAPQSSGAATVTWQARLPAGLHAQPARGRIAVAPGANVTVAMTLSADRSLAPGYYDVPVRASAQNGAPLQSAILHVRVGAPGAPLPLAYVENRFGNTVTPLDVRTGGTGPEIPVGEWPRDAVLNDDASRLYVADSASGTISVVDTTRAATIATVRVGNDPSGLALSPDGATVWFANARDGTIQSFDTRTLRVAKPIAVGNSPRSVAFAPNGKRLYVTLTGENAVLSADPATGKLGPSIPVGEAPTGLAVTPDGKRLYVVDASSNAVTPIDLTTGTALAEIPVGVNPEMIAIAPDGRTAYVSNYANATVTPIDIRTGRAEPVLNVGGAPYGVAVTRDGKELIAIARRDNAARIVDLTNGHASPPILLGNGPYTVAAP